MGEAKKPATVMSHIVLFDKEFILSIWGNDECEFLEVDAAGSVGGLLTVWNPNFFKLEASCCNRKLILVKDGWYVAAFWGIFHPTRSLSGLGGLFGVLGGFGGCSGLGLVSIWVGYLYGVSSTVSGSWGSCVVVRALSLFNSYSWRAKSTGVSRLTVIILFSIPFSLEG